MHIRHYHLINAVPGDIGQIFRYWMIYQKYISTKYDVPFSLNSFVLDWDLSTSDRKSNLSLNQLSDWLKVGRLTFTLEKSCFSSEKC